MPWRSRSRSPAAALVAAAGAAFAISTLGGYLLSLWVGLFGFTEVRTTAGIVAGIIDVAAFATLALAAAPGLPYARDLGRRILPAVAAASVVALALLVAAVVHAQDAAGGDRPGRP